MRGLPPGLSGRRFTNFVVAGSSYPKKKTTIDASNNTKCYEAVDFGFSRASAKSKGGDKSTGIDCIQSFEEDVDFENTLDNKKQKKTEKNNKKKDSNVKEEDRFLSRKPPIPEVSVVDFPAGLPLRRLNRRFAWKTQRPRRRRLKRTAKERFRLVYRTMLRFLRVVTAPEMVSSTCTI